MHPRLWRCTISFLMPTRTACVTVSSSMSLFIRLVQSWLCFRNYYMLFIIYIKHANQKSVFHFRKCSARCRKVLQAYYKSEVSTYIVSHALGWIRCFTFLICAFPFLRSLEEKAKMVILDIGLPTGFELENSDLEKVRPQTSDRS